MFMSRQIVQIVGFVVVAAYLWHCRYTMHRRSARSWESLVARLRPDGCTRELSQVCFSSHGLGATPVGRWRRIRNTHVFWAIFANAGVMIEMADYAARNGGSAVSSELLAGLRADAMLVRVCVLKALASYALSTVQENVWMNSLRAQSAYAEMELRMTEVLQLDAADMVPSFVAAM